MTTESTTLTPAANPVADEPGPSLVLVGSPQPSGGTMSESIPGRRFSRRRLALALVVALLADVISVAVTLAPPAQWVVDALTALTLFTVLGWQWLLLPGLLMEAIPGLSVFPFWVLVVAAVARWGTVRLVRCASDGRDPRTARQSVPRDNGPLAGPAALGVFTQSGTRAEPAGSRDATAS